MRITSSIKNPDGVFYTDLNGLQLVHRRTVSKLPLQGNFYPMPSSVLVQDGQQRLSLLSGQPLGTAALKQGVCVSLSVCLSVCMYVCMYVCICMSVCLYLSACLCLSVCMCIQHGARHDVMP